MTNDGTLRMRIQLKADTETNWIAHPIVPLANELIIYAADNTHHYARLKVGDGSTNVNSLPFVDAGTLNGHETEIVKLANAELFPTVGSSDKLYVDLSTNSIYHYTNSIGYSQLSNFTYTTDTTTVHSVLQWMPGVITSLQVDNNTLKIKTGELPSLLTQDKEVVTNITKEV